MRLGLLVIGAILAGLLAGCSPVSVDIDLAEVRLTWTDSDTSTLYLYAFSLDSTGEVIAVLMLENPAEYPQEFTLPPEGWARVAVAVYYADGTEPATPRLQVRGYLADDEVMDESYTGPALDDASPWWLAKYLRIDAEALEVRDYEGPTVVEIEALLDRARAKGLSKGGWVEL
jgi:hypothetical protein